MSLGSNLGDRLGYLRRGLREVRLLGTVLASSSVYETAPVGGTSDPRPYLNMAVRLETELSPEGLLLALKSVESRVGRKDSTKNMPRELDIDLVLYDRLALKSERLEIPHPRMKERRFVLEPLVEIEPDLVLPDGAKAIDLLSLVLDQEAAKIDADVSI
ncbi:MAG: 2-amino-4-hydroxy-6-hydroxymethyldihydropteridine diphosphokinase [Armatimonadetes bacterium]|nr:2-amino-4-hydroxy-6-hydroxymethyldihydropteridine diphosphokinase [Armatimonadota bacterium]